MALGPLETEVAVVVYGLGQERSGKLSNLVRWGWRGGPDAFHGAAECIGDVVAQAVLEAIVCCIYAASICRPVLEGAHLWVTNFGNLSIASEWRNTEVISTDVGYVVWDPFGLRFNPIASASRGPDPLNKTLE